jgi:hypothetical protein
MGRKQVLEDGAHVCNSESDSENEDFGEELTGMYTSDVPLDSNGTPVDGRHKPSDVQPNVLRARAAQEQKNQPPVADSSLKQSQSNGKSVSTGGQAAKAPKSTHGMTTRSKGKSGEDGQEGSAKLVPSKRKASRAGSLRPAVGSGSTDTCVAPCNPSQT